MDLESDQPTLLKLCWLIAQQWKSELAYSRAQYRVSYYRKLKAKLEVSKKTNEKWNDNIELAKKIEATRLISLKRQEELLATKKRLKGPISTAVKKLNGRLVFLDGKVESLQLLVDKSGPKLYKDVSSTQIAEMADQHEAETILNKVLTNKGNVQVMREKCEVCGEYENLNEDDVCFDCIQDKLDLEDWLPEDGYGDEEDSDEEE